MQTTRFLVVVIGNLAVGYPFLNTFQKLIEVITDVHLSRYEILLFFGLISSRFFHVVLVVALVDSELILGIQTMISM